LSKAAKPPLSKGAKRPLSKAAKRPLSNDCAAVRPPKAAQPPRNYHRPMSSAAALQAHRGPEIARSVAGPRVLRGPARLGAWVLAVLVVACFGSLPWTLGRSGVVGEHGLRVA